MCGKCCRIYTITVTPSDAYRIARFTGLKPIEFLTLVRPDERVASTYFDVPKIVLGDQNNNILSLREGHSACMFHKKNKCSIYGARPLVCRPFPFIYEIRGKKGVEFSVNDEAKSFCKGIGVESEDFDFTELTRTVREMETERETFRAKIQEWNAKVTKGQKSNPSIADLVRFLLPRIKN
jgi:Fe-S-cluster containining protein